MSVYKFTLEPMAGPIAALSDPLHVDLRAGVGLIISRFPRIADAPSDSMLGEFEGRPCVFVRDQFLSHPHAIIDNGHGQGPVIRLAHDKVRNPIWINEPSPGPNTGVREAVLHIGDQVQIGQSIFRVQPLSRWHAFFDRLYPELAYVSGSEPDANGYAIHKLQSDTGDVRMAECQHCSADDPQTAEHVPQLAQRLQTIRRKQEENRELAQATPTIRDVQVLRTDTTWTVVMLRDAIEYPSLASLALEYRTPLITSTALRFGMALCTAVHAFNRYGLHRNLTPANVYFHQGGEPSEDRVALGGLFAAKAQSGAATMTNLGVDDDIAYRPPEQVDHGEYTERSDQYAVAILVGVALSGHPPYEAKTPVELAMKVVNAQPRLPDDVTPRIKAVLQKAWAKKPNQRFPLVLDLRLQLQRLLSSGATR